MIKELRVSSKISPVRYDYKKGEMYGEYFIIENDGALGMYNKEGRNKA